MRGGSGGFSAAVVVIARDRMGVKPVYFTQTAGQFLFGSEMKVLLAHPDVTREIDLIYMYFILGKGQKQMARILGITQGAVSLRLRKAIKRLQFLANLPKIDPEEMENLFKKRPEIANNLLDEMNAKLASMNLLK